MGLRGCKEPFISIVIPIYNRKKLLLLTLESINKSNYKDFEIIIVDDCSTENLEEIKNYSCQIIKLGKKSGPGIARNIGASHAKGEIIQFLDSDVIIPPDLLSTVFDYFKKNSIDCLVGTYSEDSPCKNITGQFKNLFIRYTYISLPTINTFHACVTAIRKSVFLESGGFDTRLTTAGIEDVKYGQALAKKGYKIKFSPDYYVTHLKCYTPFEMAYNDFRKGAELVSIMLKDHELSDMIMSKKQIHSNKNYTITIPLSFLLVFFIIYFIFTYNIMTLSLVLMCFVIYIINQLDFLKYLAKVNGLFFSLKSIPLLFLNSYMFGFAILYGYIKHVTTHVFRMKDEDGSTK